MSKKNSDHFLEYHEQRAHRDHVIRPETPFANTNTNVEAFSPIESMVSLGITQSVSEKGFARVKPMQPTHCGTERTCVDALLNGAHVFTYIDFPVYV